jgi:16S rRNA (guanine(966)-N(2))-methyltransferase RsmD
MGKRERRPKTSASRPAPRDCTRPVVGLRIIGGRFRGRKLHYSGDLRTRPMKDRLREAIFNLVGPLPPGTQAWDLFAGTGALGLEALSRGAERATFLEQHYPTADIIRQNIAALGVAEQADVVTGNVFIGWPRPTAAAPADKPWLVFCSPPYDFYVRRTEEMLNLIVGLIRAAPVTSLFVVEADERFDFQTLPNPAEWDVRVYPPATVGIYRKE